MSRKYGMVDHDLVGLVGDGVTDNKGKMGPGGWREYRCDTCGARLDVVDTAVIGAACHGCGRRDGVVLGDTDKINPGHYKSHPSGVECIQITEHMDFLLGNAMKYIWRAGLKGDEVEDLKKAKWYLERAISKRG